MKKVFITLALLAFCGTAQAGVQEQKVQSDLIDIAQEAREISVQCDRRLSALKTKVDSIKANYAGGLTQADKDAFTSIFQKLGTARTACSEATATIDTEYPNLDD